MRSSLSEKMFFLLQSPGKLDMQYAICTCSIVTSEVLLLDDGTLVYAICNMQYMQYALAFAY